MEEKLTGILGEEILLYEELLALLQEEKRLLAKRSLDELHELSTRIETLVFKAKGLEKLRLEVVDALKGSFNLTDTALYQVTLTEILTHTNEPHRSTLKQLQATFLALASSIEELNKQNSVVVGSSMDNIKNAFLFLREISALQTYKPDGIRKDPSTARES